MEKNKKIKPKSEITKVKLTSFLTGGEAKNSFHKIKASLFAIAIGLLIGIIIMASSNVNVFTTLMNLFWSPIKNIFALKKTLIMIAIFVLLGVGIGISFKTGLFNIGAAGQFLFAGAITVVMGIQMDISKGLAIPLLLVVSLVVGGLVAAFAGILKAFFNVHEVVSTILLNWVLFYITKGIFKDPSLKSTTSDNSLAINSSMHFDKSSFIDIISILVMVLAIVTFIWFIFKYTTFGYRMKVNGLNINVAKYSGMNTKTTTIFAMTLSGALAGMAGFIYYGTLQQGMPALGGSLPTLGFEAITVTLLAFSSPFGAVLSGIFYGILKEGVDFTTISGLNKYTMELILGIIIFSAALAPVFIKIHPWRKLKYHFLCWNNKEIVALHKNFKEQIRQLKNGFLKIKNQHLADLNAEKKLYQAQTFEKGKYYKAHPQELEQLVFEHNIKYKIKTIMEHKWNQEIILIHKNHQKTLLEKDLEIKQVNLKYQALLSKYRFDDYKIKKQSYKTEIKQLKRDQKIHIMEIINRPKIVKTKTATAKGGA